MLPPSLSRSTTSILPIRDCQHTCLWWHFLLQRPRLWRICETYSRIWRANKYGVLNQSDFNLIFEKLDTVKYPTQDSSAVLAEFHRDLKGLLAGAGQISTEYLKKKYLADALKHDPLVCMPSRSSIAASLLSQIALLKTSDTHYPRSNLHHNQLQLRLF